jgi:hypothetical protein
MSNTVAFSLAALILGLLVVDALVFDWQGLVFLGRKLLDVLDKIAWWRKTI